MNMKKCVLAALAGFAVMFSISGLWYLVIMRNFYSTQFAEVNRPEENMIWIVIGYIVAAILLAFIYPIGYKGGDPAKEGLRFGILMGLIMILPVAFILFGVYKFPLTGSLVDTIYQIVEKSIGGVVIGLVFGRGGKSGV